MSTPTPNKWNPKTTTVYSSRGSAKEIPLGDYDKFIGQGWGATAPSAPKVETKPLAGQTPPVEIGKQPAKKVETPTAPKTASVAAPQANYSGLENRDGTIYLGDRAFSNPAELATHLGIQPHEINWGNIPTGTAATPTAEPPVVAPQPTPKTTRSLIDIANSRPDVLATAKAQGGDPFTAGTPANTWLNNWWNTAGKNEFPDVILGEPIDEQTQITDQANDIQTEFFDNLPDGDDLDVSQSQLILEEIQEWMKTNELPKPVSQEELFNETMKDLEIEPNQTRMAEIDNEMDAINAELLMEGEKMPEGLVTTAEINRRKGTYQKEAENRILRLQIERDGLARILSNKINTLNMVMQFSQQDYQNSVAYYKANFDRAIQMYNLVSGAEDREMEIEEKAEQEAKANLTIISDIMQESGTGYDGLSEEQILQINSLETQAGLPVGLFQFTLDKDPEAKIQTVTSRTDSAGNTYFDVLKVGPDGEMTVDSIFKGVGKMSTSGSGGTSETEEKIVEWSEENERAGVVGWTQEKLDWVMNSPIAPPEFEQIMSEEYQESRASWQKEWDEQRNSILNAYRDEDTTEVEDQFSSTQISKGATNAGMSISEFIKLPVDKANEWINKKSSGRTY